ncbi:class I SAM-dependent methyltransferase [Maridesulfovibrio sp.]|uniref:class I SAM-dependent methyltransferase n=1 Tax=Maridesulfovibrio sp. TaxID=2795000 RepID=UPI002A186CD4|nr:class I SAM-dependent methyltransferase [Maridesulfovibrio sp.]
MDSDKINCLEYWEGKGAEKNFTTPFKLDIFSKYVSPEAAVLDVGCGYGRIINELRRTGYADVHGVEPSAGLRARAEELSCSAFVSSLENGVIPFEDNRFDAVLLIAVLTCIPTDGEQSALVDEIRRVLKPGGILYINDFMLNSDQRNLDRYAKYEPKHGCYGVFELEGGGVLRHFSEERIVSLLDSFTTVEFEKVVYTTMNGNTSNGFYYIGRR